MSIDQADVVDIVSTNRITGHVVLTITDHMDWSNSNEHQILLQKKLNRYLAFVESGEIFENYPDAKDRQVVFKVVFQFPPDELGRAFLARVKSVVESAGYSLIEEVFTGARFN
jgi:hypothetical protein